MTVAELDDRVAKIRGALTGRGVTDGDRVLVVAGNERESVAAYHAVVSVGAVAVLSHVGAGGRELEVACQQARPVLAILSPPAVADGVHLPAAVEVVASTALDAEPAAATHQQDPTQPKVVVFTSGTTSVPKGVVHSAASIDAAVACFQATLELRPDDRLFLVSPLASITGVLQVLELAPSVGAAAILEPDFDAEKSLDLLLDAGGTVYGGPDTVLDRLLVEADARGVEVPLRLAALGGTMLRRELIDTAENTFGIRVVRVYGSSEAPCSTGTRAAEPDELRLTDEGTAGPGVELKTSDDGELLVRGAHLFTGYLDPVDDADARTEGWFHTGDEAVITDGRLKITGRLKDVVSRNGKKISLAEVDLAFTAATGITECAAFGMPDRDTGERVALAVRLDDPTALDIPIAIAAMEASGLARWKLPETVVHLQGPLPLTPTGKVQRRALGAGSVVLWQRRRS